MTDYKPSIINYVSQQITSRCGYCKSNDGFCTYGLHAYCLKVEDYQSIIDRGWRRSGKYCYKAIMHDSCCPLYTIRCAAKDFKLSKSQKKIIKRFNNFLINGTISKDKIVKKTEIEQPMEMYHLDNSHVKVDESKMEVSYVDPSLCLNAESEKSDMPEANKKKPVESVKKLYCVSPSIDGKKDKNKCMKAKYLRIERKREKLQKLGLSTEEIAKKMVEKKKYPVIKTIEDYIKLPTTKNQVHNLRISFVRSCPRSEDFNRTLATSFSLYERYQRFIHKDPPEKLNVLQFERFLVTSPLQIQLVLVKPSEMSFFKESASLFAKYQKAIHHESDEDCDVTTYTNFLLNSPLQAVDSGYGSYHQQYWLDDKLIAVGVIDILPKCLSSVYFFYDPDYSHLSLGTYGALREVEFTRRLSHRFPDLAYYYMGYYIHSCVKMKYKGAFKPSFLLCPEVYTWHPIEKCLPKLEESKYSRLNEDPEASDSESDIPATHVSVLYNKVAMPLRNYVRKKNVDMEEMEEITEYAKLVGRSCAKNMLLLRV